MNDIKSFPRITCCNKPCIADNITTEYVACQVCHKVYQRRDYGWIVNPTVIWTGQQFKSKIKYNVVRLRG